MTYFRVVVALAATLWLLIQIRDFLQPILIAVIVWALINAVAATLARAINGPSGRPTRRVLGVSALALLAVIVTFSGVVAGNLRELTASLPEYEANIDAMLRHVSGQLGLPNVVYLADLVSNIDVEKLAITIIGSAASVFGALIVILFYVIFMFAEQSVFAQKFVALFVDQPRRDEATKLLGQIGRDIERYLAVKLVLGVVQAAPTYLVLALVGVDAAPFWAAVIFFTSFIPTIGTLIGIIFPSLLTLAQFGDLATFLTVVGCLAAVQLLASNALEPRLMGQTLNLSPLAVFAAIFAGGALWGIVGALVVVPVLSIAVIGFSQIPSMRPVAILLSADGRIDKTPRSAVAP